MILESVTPTYYSFVHYEGGNDNFGCGVVVPQPHYKT